MTETLDDGLVDAFAARVDARLDATEIPRADLAQMLAELLVRARAKWPGIVLDGRHFVAYFAERLEPGATLAATLDATHGEDLFLACACAGGNDDAIAELERRHRTSIEAALAKIEPARGGPTRDDVLQALRLRLFVGMHGEPPGIVAYRGRGRLSAWLHVTVMRAALNAVRDSTRPSDDDLRVALVTLAADPEFEDLRLSFRDAFASCFSEAVSSLSVRERALLRHALIDRLNVRQVARVYGVHFTTAARWIASARETLAAETRRLLAQQLDVSDSELHRLIVAVQSRIELSISRLFAPDDPASR